MRTSHAQKITAPNAHHLILSIDAHHEYRTLPLASTVHQKYTIPSTLCPTIHHFSFMSNYTAVLSASLNTSILFFSLPRRSSKSCRLTVVAFGSAPPPRSPHPSIQPRLQGRKCPQDH